MKATPSLLAVVFVLAGCSSSPSPSARPDPPLAGGPTSAMTIIWWHPHTFFQTAGVFIDGKRCATLKPHTFAELTLAPGPHEVTVKFLGLLGAGMPVTTNTFEFTQNRNHFMSFSFDMKIRDAIPVGPAGYVRVKTMNSIREMSPEDGAIYVEKLRKMP